MAKKLCGQHDQRGILNLGNMTVEMITAVAERVAPKDMYAFRLCSKTLHDCIQNTFAHEYFLEVRTFLSRISLRNLVAICAHPDFGPVVTTIAFTHQIRWTYISDDDYEFVGEASLELQAGATELLSTALRHLCNIGRSVHLCTYEPESISHSRVPGLNRVTYKDHDYSDCCGLMACKTSTLRTLLTAAYRSGCDVSSLTIDHQMSDWIDQDFTLQGYGNGGLDQVLSRLERFTLAYEPCCDLCNASYQELVRRMSDLHSLDIDMHCSTFDNGFRPYGCKEFCGLTSTFNIENLRELTLTRLAAESADLAHLLVKHKKSLRSLVFASALLDGSWLQMLAWLSDNMSLTELKLSSLGEQNR